MSIADSDKQYEELLELYDETDDQTVKKEILNRINAQAYGARISRLEGLKRNVYIYFRHVANEAIKEQKKLYDSAVKTAYYTNIFDTAQGLNCGIDFSLVPQKAVNMVLREPWHGHNYSDRVWIHNDRFIQAVGQTIEDGIISGHSVSRMTDKLIDYVKDTAPGGIRTSAETLVRSETAHFMNQGQRMAYEEIGIKQYRFVAALSELTCDRCGSLDGSVFDTDKAIEGEHFPPIHPRCRCVTIMADVNLTSRIARDPLTGENYKVDGSMTFDEWKNGLSDEQKNALKYVANSEKRGIIKARSGSVALENQRYGRNKVTLVNKTYIESGEYKRKFDNISENKAVNKTLYDCAKAALKHRSGTKFEDMYWIDLDEIRVIAEETNSLVKKRIIYSNKIIKKIQSCKNIITIHSHPDSFPPSIADFNSNYDHNYVVGIVACHNGKLYMYFANERINEDYYKLVVEGFLKIGYNEEEAQIKALENLQINFDIKFKEVTDYDCI